MSKPTIEVQSGPAPQDLLIEDITVGDGPEAQAGSNVEVHYVGVDFETGEEFDSSWDRGQTITFPLTGLIAGWQEGIPGMRVGGRRKLTIPPGHGIWARRHRPPARRPNPRVRYRSGGREVRGATWRLRDRGSSAETALTRSWRAVRNAPDAAHALVAK